MSRFSIRDLVRFGSRFLAEPECIGEVWDTLEERLVVDLRAEPRSKGRGKPKGQRPWSQITGITLHQTAVDFGDDPMRLLDVPVHDATLRNGLIVVLNSPTAYMYHAGGFNRRDLGIEVSCRAAGIEGDPRTVWLPRKLRGKGSPLDHVSEATDIQLASTRRLIRARIELVAANGGEIRYMHAHRQETSQRTSDPGSRIWHELGEWAIREFGLSSGSPKFQIGTGKALPDAWTGRPNGVRYNWRVDGRLPRE